jgi:TolB protein
MKFFQCSRLVIACCLAIYVTFLGAIPAHAELRIDITQGRVEPMPIAVTDFSGKADREVQIGADISQVISDNLERSGLFKPLDRLAFIQAQPPMDLTPRFADWRVLNAQAMAHGVVDVLEDGSLQVDFRLWDVFSGEQMVAQRLTAAVDGWRRLAHIISDAIYRRITGEGGYFDTRIVYIAETGAQNRRIKRLAIMDQDGAKHQFLTDGSNLVLTPRFSPTLQEITYLSYFNDTPRVYIFDIETGRQEVLGEFPGMTFAPRFGPEGKRVIMSMAKDGNSDIFSMDIGTRKVTRLTNHSGIDTSPSFAPDGENIIFNSDRGGSQQLYRMNANGSDVKRISFGKGRYATPNWSPRGDLIAFTKFHGGTFYIGVMRPDGSGERQLAKGFLVEGPTWSPNGRVLMFFRQTRSDSKGLGGRSRVFSIDLTGYNEREVITPLDASDPAWSPSLHLDEQ